MSEPTPDTAATPRVIRDQAFLDIYANQLRIGASFADLTLIFGVIDDRGPGDLVVLDKAAVRLSPTAAKILYLHLGKVIETYEKAVKPIPVPAGLNEQLALIPDRLTKILSGEMEIPAPISPTPPRARK